MKVAIIDDVAAHYRLLLWQILSRNTDPEYTFFAPERELNGISTIDPELSRLSVEKGGIRWFFLSNILVKKMIIWQKGVLKYVIKGDFDVFILPGEVQIISNWFAILIGKLRGRKIALWGHGLYGNEKYFKRWLRLLFYKLTDMHFVYNERAKNLLLKYGFKEKNLVVIYNSLNYDLHNQFRANLIPQNLKETFFPRYPDLPVLIFIGRLTSEKKLDQLIRSVYNLSKTDKKVNCLIVGDGPKIKEMEELVSQFGIKDHLYFYGACYDDKDTGMLLNISDCCVSPGNVGLTAIHSMSFGTPVISHNCLEYQMPEVSAVIEGETGEFFEQDNITDLTEKIIEVAYTKGKLYYKNNCFSIIENYYNPYKQMDIFNKALGELIRK
jgi:glycosyltransferase involved in cell wall biosynthesis